MPVTLYHSPLSCSVASRFALAEAGIAHDVVIINVLGGGQHSADYRAVNPRGKVPALVTDYGTLTESTAILPYIADMAPASGLFPAAGTFERSVAQSWLSFLSSTLHTSYTGAFRPDRLSTDPAHIESIRAANIGLVADALAVLDSHLASRDTMLDRLSVCDFYALAFLLWRGSPVVAGKLPTFAALDAFQARLTARPAVTKVMAEDMQSFASMPAAQHTPADGD
jgi:glutathione S-transferase